jgi:hypothetical protein
MREGIIRSGLVVALMMLIISATVTMGWASHPTLTQGASLAAESPDHSLRRTILVNNHQGEQTMPPILAGGNGNSCCACDGSDAVRLPVQSGSCTAARISHRASLPQPLELEPPQAPPRA